MSDLTVSELYDRYSDLVKERKAIIPVWRRLAENFLPVSRPLLEDSYDVDEVYSGMGTVNDFILDDTPVKCLRVFAAGMQSGLSSSSKLWCVLGHPDVRVQNMPSASRWLYEATRTMFDQIGKTNFYDASHSCYEENGVFGTDVMLILEDDERPFRCECLPAGSYVLELNGKGDPSGLYRSFVMTAYQIVDEYGEDMVSEKILESFRDSKRRSARFEIVNAILPNRNADSSKRDVFSMPYSSYHFELSEASSPKAAFLRESGFRDRPFMASRWNAIPNCAYGSSPCMDVLNFARGLQAMKSTVYKAEQKNADPAMNVPPGMKTASTSPGVRNYQVNPNEKITATTDIKPNTVGALTLIQDDRRQIVEGLFNDVFRALAVSSSDERKTATEIMEIVAEGLRQLGPMTGRRIVEFFNPAIDRIFAILMRKGVFPDPPPEIEGTELKVEYISPFAMAMKSSGLESVDKLIVVLERLAQLKPESLDNVNFDELLRDYASSSVVSPLLLNDEDEVTRVRAVRDEYRRAAMALEAGRSRSETMKRLSETKIGEDSNALEAEIS